VTPAPPPSFRPWTVGDVVDADVPAFALRTYLEQSDLRSLLRQANAIRPLDAACELGCGYGRMTVVLGEFARQVVGFERQPRFVEIARRLHPSFRFYPIDGLGALPTPDRSFDLVLTFTVLQHVTERTLKAALDEIRRIVRPGGFVLLCEDTNPASQYGDPTDESGFCVIGRSLRTYSDLLAPFRLLSTSPRRVEPTYPVQEVGTYLLFQA
jgi:SAM-dependent methyltransferase